MYGLVEKGDGSFHAPDYSSYIDDTYGQLRIEEKLENQFDLHQYRQEKGSGFDDPEDNVRGHCEGCCHDTLVCHDICWLIRRQRRCNLPFACPGGYMILFCFFSLFSRYMFWSDWVRHFSSESSMPFRVAMPNEMLSCQLPIWNCVSACFI